MALAPEVDEDIDLFASDDDDCLIFESHPRRHQKASEKCTMLMVVFYVSPLEADTDMNELERHVRSVVSEGLLEWKDSKLIPIAYGLRKLQIAALIVNEISIIEDIEEKILENEEMAQSVDVVSFTEFSPTKTLIELCCNAINRSHTQRQVTRLQTTLPTELIELLQSRYPTDSLNNNTTARITIDIKPIDAEVDMNELEHHVRSIVIQGLEWKTSQFVNFVYGHTKLRITAEITGDKLAEDLSNAVKEQILKDEERVASVHVVA
eukprot:TRINITY_DN4647_c0_g2_i2.p1 TRINITY_DN4647_c0_g2~~TRINITY_DN4647_c0_g2_i2.p1  ORF type:complete len:265 (-),score=72.28 TRINITY_DN4647_c0_g2_i2:409-1203(-)